MQQIDPETTCPGTLLLLVVNSYMISKNPLKRPCEVKVLSNINQSTTLKDKPNRFRRATSVELGKT